MGNAVTELVRWESERGPVIVEMDDTDPGFELVSRVDDVMNDAKKRLEDAMGGVRGLAESALDALRQTSVTPDTVELEFGLKLNVAAGAVIARTAVEGQVKVKIIWSGAAVEAAGDDDEE
jgi:hypothetical protein